MAFNQNDPSFEQHLLSLDEPIIQLTLDNTLTLNELVMFEPRHPHLRVMRDEALHCRSELSIAFGTEALTFCCRSKLWHEYQNGLAQFPGGVYQTMHQSFLETYLSLDTQLVQGILLLLPNIRTLNIMLDLGSIYPENRNLTTINLAILIHRYAPQLETFRLWARGERLYQQGNWSSTLMQDFVPSVWYLLSLMSQCKVLWLELQEDVQPVPAGVGPPEVVPLEICLQNQNFPAPDPKLREFRFVAEFIDPLLVVADRLLAIGTLTRVHILNLYTFDDWDVYDENYGQRFREIAMLVEKQVTLGQLVNLFHRFRALTRVTIWLSPDGPRFISIFRALAQAPNLKVLNITIQQSTLFTPAEVTTIRQDRPAPLAALQILIIDMDIAMTQCTSISVAPLFPDPNPSGKQSPFQLLPNLTCFKMAIREGACRTCVNQDDCILAAVIQWFCQLPNAAQVDYSNARHHTFGVAHEITVYPHGQPSLQPLSLDD